MAIDSSRSRPGRQGRRVYLPAGQRPGPQRKRARLAGLVVAFALVLALIAGFIFDWSQPSLAPDSAALAQIDLPFGAGRVVDVSASGPGGTAIPIALRAGKLWPSAAVRTGEPITVTADVKRPGAIAWLTGDDHERIRLRAPSASLRNRYLTLSRGAPLRVAFDQPVRVIAFGQPGTLTRQVLPKPEAYVTLPRPSQAGSIEVAAAARVWEALPAPAVVSWFPRGTTATAVASPAPGSRISPTTPISLTFSQPVATVLGSATPRTSPATPGAWHAAGDHTLVFTPAGYGYGLGASVSVDLPGSVRVAGGADAGSVSSATWTVPSGSTLRAQQILAELGYLPVQWTPVGADVAHTPSAEEAAAISPPGGSFNWPYANVPSPLRAQWQAGQNTVVMRGAVMAFEQAHGLTTDGVVGPRVWSTLLNAAVADQRSTGGYSYVSVDEASQSLVLWHNGKTILTTPVNTGAPGTATATGTFPVFEHIASGTMSGTTPGGGHYEDQGIPWISYFNGGDALHGFTRAQYGSPQSLGCVEMPIATAGRVWPYTPIGTLVNIT